MIRARPLLGSFVEITVDAAGAAAEQAVEAAFGTIATVHRLMSFHEAQSDVSRVNREAAARAVPVHAWTFRVLTMAADLHTRSAGVFDITIADALQRRGLLPGAAAPLLPLPACGERVGVRGSFNGLGVLRGPLTRPRRRGPPAACGSGESSGHATSPARPTIELLRGHRVFFRYPAVRIDLGGIAKGFAVDRAVETLRRHRVRSGIVNAGGDLAAFGREQRTVDLRDPRDPRQSIARLTLREAALASSAGRFDPARSIRPEPPAVIDPRDGATVRGVLGATVRAPTCMVADALTKVVMLAPDAAPLAHYRAAALLVGADGDVRVTADLEACRAP